MAALRLNQDNRIVLILAIVIVIFCSILYTKSIKVPFIYDDWNSIAENSHIQKLWPIWEAMSSPPGSGIEDRPIVCLSLSINYALGKYNPQGYHIFNLVIHILSTLVLMGIIRRTLLLPKFKKQFSDSAPWLAFSVAIIWTIHPLLTEAVTYVIQRTELLMSLFYLLTLYCSIRYWTSSQKTSWLIAAIVFCIMGVGSKEVMFSAPLIVFIYHWLFISGSFNKSLNNNKILFAGLFATWLLLFAFITSGPGNNTIGFKSGVSSFEYLLTQAGVILHYLRLSILPNSLSISYHWPYVESFLDSMPESLVILALLISTVYAFNRKLWLGFLGLWFFFILAPTSSIVPIVTEIAAERRMYLPLAAIVVLFVILFYILSIKLAKKMKIPARSMFLIRTVFVLFLLAGFSLMTFNRLDKYKTRISIWTDALEKYPHNDHAHNNIGIAFEEQKRYDEAIFHYKEAIRYKYSNPEAHNNLGIVLVNQGKVEDAIPYFKNAIKIKPDYANAVLNLGLAMQKLNEIEKAISHFKRALQINPHFIKAQTALANTLTQAGDADEAITHFTRILKNSPDDINANYNLGVALKNKGQTKKAIRYFSKVLRIDPNHIETYNQLGIIATELGQFDKAQSYYNKTLKINPEYNVALSNLGELLNRQRKFKEAARYLTKALAIDNNFESAHVNLGISLAQMDRIDSAVFHFKEAARINPKFEKAYLNLGNAMAIQGKITEAIHNFLEANKINPDNIQIHNSLGLLFTKQQNYIEAQKHYSEVLRLQPNNEIAKKNLEQIKEKYNN
jgi:tetratricopeptide (TPR) repeat protein